MKKIGFLLIGALRKRMPLEQLRKLVTSGDPHYLPSRRALNEAIMHQNSFEVIQFLIQSDARPSHSHLYTAVESCSPTNVIQLLISHGADPSEYILLRAIECENPHETIELLLNLKVECSDYCLAAANKIKDRLNPKTYELIEEANLRETKVLVG